MPTSVFTGETGCGRHDNLRCHQYGKVGIMIILGFQRKGFTEKMAFKWGVYYNHRRNWYINGLVQNCGISRALAV